MHLSEALLSNSESGQIILGAGIVLAAAGTAVGLRKLDYERIPRVAMLSSVFFVASLIHVSLGGVTEVHLVLNGLVGLMLGWAAFPALLIALVLQAVFFQFGGPLAVGVNTVVMATPAVVCYYLFHRPVRGRRPGLAVAAGVGAGAAAPLLSAVLTAAILALLGEGFIKLAWGLLIAYLPIAAIEGSVVGAVVAFLRKVDPQLLDAPLMISLPVEAHHG